MNAPLANPPAFDLQPSLRGDLLELRSLRPDDFDALYAVASDPLIWEQHPSSDRWQPEIFRAFFRESLDSGGAMVVIERATGRVIGSSRYFGYDPKRGEIEIGWSFLARAYWGGRYNAEMKRLMLEHAFRFVERVVFLVGPFNHRSQRALEKIGAARTGVRVRDGRESVVFTMTADMYDRTMTSTMRAPKHADGRARSPQIREYADDDRPGVLSCLAQLQDAERQVDPHLPRGEDIAEAYLQAIERRCDRWDGRTLVAELDGRIVGVVTVYSRVPFESPDDPAGTYALLGDLVVDASERRRGVGARLLALAVEVARTQGAAELRVELLADNADAARLYDAAGFVPYLVTRRKML